MKNIKSSVLVILILFSLKSYAQSEIVDRLQVLQSKAVKYYNIDGYLITSEIFNSDLKDKRLKAVLRKYNIKDDDAKTKNTGIIYDNFYVRQELRIADSLIQKDSYYFIENKEKMTVVIQFSAMNETDKDFENSIIDLILEKKIPKENFASLRTDNINFVGRKMRLSGSCYWTNVNTIQCPYCGEMNWGLHKDLKDAQKTVNEQLMLTKSRNGVKVTSEELVDIEFENTPTKAKKVVTDFTGVKSLLAGASGGKTLTIYYVAEKIRNNYISCVLSFWNNDEITETGLPPLLNEVMKIKI